MDLSWTESRSMSLDLSVMIPYFISDVESNDYPHTVTLDRTFTDTPTYGGGNRQPLRFIHDGENWELWQVIPYVGQGVGPAASVGDCRLQLRNRDKNRGQNLLTDMPDRVTIESDDFVGTPWTYTRGTANADFGNVASGNSARKSVNYNPDFDIAANPAAAGIAQGETLTITLHWD